MPAPKQADTQRCRATGAGEFRQAAIDNAQAMLGYTKIMRRPQAAPVAAGRSGQHHSCFGRHRSCDHYPIQPIAVQFSLPQQQIVRVNAASARCADRRCVRQ
jgi:multidrug efflux system membrane fusion protein